MPKRSASHPRRRWTSDQKGRRPERSGEAGSGTRPNDVIVRIYIDEDGTPSPRDFDVAVVQIGRGADNQIVSKDPRASRHHCRIVETPHGFFLEDLKSRNGTLLNGRRVERQLLREGDAIQIGSTRYFFGRPGAGAAEPSATLAARDTAVPGPAAPGGSAGGPVDLEDVDDIPLLEDIDAEDEDEAEDEPSAAGAPEPARPAGGAEPPSDSNACLLAGEVYLEGLQGVHAGKRIPITKLPYTIGRRPNNDFRIEDRRASGNHARVVRRGEVFFVEDLQSRNGTMVNGKAVRESPLVPGCRLQIGDSQFRVQVPAVEGVVLEEALPPEADAPADGLGEEVVSRQHVQELLREAESARSQPLALVAILLIAGAILYFTVDVTLSRLRTRNPDPIIDGNRVPRNWSFEEVEEGAPGVPGWSALPEGALDLRAEADGAQWPGLLSLAVEPRAGARAGPRLLQAASEPISVDADAAYHVSSRVVHRGAFAAGLMVTWLRETGDGLAEVGRSFAGALRQSGEVDDLLRRLSPPPSTTHAQVAGFVITTDAAGGGAGFDRVFFGARAPSWLAESAAASDAGAEAAPAPEAGSGAEAEDGALAARSAGWVSWSTALPLRAASPAPGGAAVGAAASAAELAIEAELEADGSLSHLRRGQVPVLTSLAPGLPPEQDPLGIGSRLSETVLFNRDGDIRLLCQVVDLAAGDWVPVEVRVRAQGETLLVSYAFQKGRASGALPDEVALALAPALADSDWTAFGESGKLNGDAAAGKVFGDARVRELIFGRERSQVVLEFEPAVLLEILPAEAGRPHATIVARASPTGSRSRDLDLRVTRVSRQEDRAVDALLEDARRLHAQGKLAEALAKLASVRAQYSWRRPTVDLATQLEQAWIAEAKAAIAGLERELEIYRRFRSPLIHQSLVAKTEALAKGLRGSREHELRLQAIDAQLRRLHEEGSGLGARSARLFEAGRTLYEAEAIHRAEFQLRAMLDVGAGKPEETRRASELLELIRIKRKGKAPGLK
jgi:pSer/pThr/pTyr-binding forkhead associated (FHA) protein